METGALVESEEAAVAWLQDALDVSRETLAQLDRYRTLLVAEASRQNLISASTIDHFWARHIVDSAQLLLPAWDAGSRWIDLGSGAGLPGVVIALIAPERHVTLVESRALRVQFLEHVVGVLGLGDRMTIEARAVERLEPRSYDVISARAFAPLAKTLDLAAGLSTEKTLWVLPKGRSAVNELASVARTWHVSFHVEHSVTSADAGIIVGRVKGRRKPPTKPRARRMP